MHNKNIYIHLLKSNAFPLSKPITYWMSCQNSPRILFRFPLFPMFFFPCSFPMASGWERTGARWTSRLSGDFAASMASHTSPSLRTGERVTTMVPAEEFSDGNQWSGRKIMTNPYKSTVCCSILHLQVVRNRQANDPIFHNNFPTGETGPTSAREA